MSGRQPSAETIAARISFELGAIRLEAVARRVEAEGLTRDAVMAWCETLGELTEAICALDRARYAMEWEA